MPIKDEISVTYSFQMAIGIYTYVCIFIVSGSAFPLAIVFAGKLALVRKIFYISYDIK